MIVCFVPPTLVRDASVTFIWVTPIFASFVIEIISRSRHVFQDSLILLNYTQLSSSVPAGTPIMMETYFSHLQHSLFLLMTDDHSLLMNLDNFPSIIFTTPVLDISLSNDALLRSLCPRSTISTRSKKPLSSLSSTGCIFVISFKITSAKIITQQGDTCINCTKTSEQ